MKKVVGLWIDHTKAVIFSLGDEGANIKRVLSVPDRQGRVSEKRHETIVPVATDGESNIHLAKYYDEVLSHIRDAESILIFGPGEAKLELKKRLEDADLHSHIVGIETIEKMTDNQIVTKIRQRFLT